MHRVHGQLQGGGNGLADKKDKKWRRGGLIRRKGGGGRVGSKGKADAEKIGRFESWKTHLNSFFPLPERSPATSLCLVVCQEML